MAVKAAGLDRGETRAISRRSARAIVPPPRYAWHHEGFERALATVSIVAVLLVFGLVAVAIFIVRAVRARRWWIHAIEGVGYFGLTTAEKRAFENDLRERTRPLVTLFTLVAKLKKPSPPVGVKMRGITAPPQCRAEDFHRAMHYQADARDVFVVTQMKCGTTWMQQIVYETLLRGRGDLSDTGSRHIYAVSPWIEASWAVPLDEAPRLGERGRRLIKTHMPAKLLPISEHARYIYVTRHPAACFASCADFVTMLMGPLAGSRETLLEWFTSERMWWGPWPDHVDGWWRASEAHSNVMFVHFEEMRADLGAVVDRVAAFLDVTLSSDERAAVVRKSHFDFMKQHEDRFSMAPPTPFGSEANFLRSGKIDRHADVLPYEKDRIAEFCRNRLCTASYPVARFYPDLSPDRLPEPVENLVK